jgi:hypothetical protein
MVTPGVSLADSLDPGLISMTPPASKLRFATRVELAGGG